ncbi:50S ribosomal protein L23 [bacterium]|nr:MAG: 50S ribosomal protein L23 [bacterium]
MRVMEARDVIIAPLITEKSMSKTMTQQYTFRVDPAATKTQIRHAVEEIFKVNVTKVNTVNVKGKTRSFARRRARPTVGRQSDWKKAIVTVKDGQKIELGGVNYFEQ